MPHVIAHAFMVRAWRTCGSGIIAWRAMGTSFPGLWDLAGEDSEMDAGTIMPSLGRFLI